MRTRPLILLCFICCTFSTETYCQDEKYIKLPFEFFYGRWVDGHLGKISSKYMERRKPDYTGSYSLTSGDSYFAISNIQKYLLVSERKKIWESATLAYSKRIQTNWQIGLDRVSFNESNIKLERAELNQFNIYDYNSSNITGSISSHFANNDTLTILGLNGAYSYYFEPIFSVGTVRLDNIVDLAYQRNSYDGISFGDSGYVTETALSKSSVHNWNFRNSFLWGAKNWLNFSGGLDFGYSVTNWESYYLGDFQGRPLRQSKDEGRNLVLAPELNLSATSKILDKLFLKLNYWNWYSKSEHTTQYVSTYLNTDSITFVTKHNETPLHSQKWQMSGNVRFINSGAFDNAIILDDYQGFYKKMLFKNQLLFDMSFEFLQLLYGSEVNNYKLRLTSNYGISNKINIGGFAEYRFLQPYVTLKSEEISSSLLFRYRSYDYSRGSGFGWERDSKYDQVLGPILKLGQWYSEIQYTPPQLRNKPSSDLHFFSFSKIRVTKDYIVSFRTQFGIGRRTAIIVKDQENYSKYVFPQRAYGIGIFSRFIEQIGIGFTYNQVYGSSKYRDPTVEVSIQAFL